MKALKITIVTICVILLVLVDAYFGILWYLNSSAGRFPTEGAMYPAPNIQRLIWPTIGYPAMVVPGQMLEVEVDAEGDASGWRAVIEPSRDELSGISYALQYENSVRATSGRWPEGTKHGSGDVWHLRFTVPEEVVPELYDLTIEFDSSDQTVSDRQLNSVSVTEDDDDDFRFITMADIHVHGRGISTWLQPQTDKGISPDGEPLYFEEAIEQVNLIRPDFVVLLGDFVRAQHEPGDYLPEFETFYGLLDTFEVPVFTLPGNHDLYINGVDGRRIWEENLGPLYYSFDVGGCHFTCLNTFEWPRGDRIVMKKFGLFVFPEKWQGRILSADDETDVATYSGQLAWARDDLAAHDDSSSRTVLLHHDPYTPGGEGVAYGNETYFGIYRLGGGGSGRIALREMASRYRVDMVMGGHLHYDSVGSEEWSGSDGETVYACQTCVYFDEGGKDEKYPGYRLVKVRDGKVTEFAYLDGVHSMPFYDGSVLGDETDLDNLEIPAISAASSSAGVWEVRNYLGVPVELRGLVADVPVSATDLTVEGGEIYSVIPTPDGSLVYVRAVVDKGVPGESSTEPGVPSTLDVSIVSGAGAYPPDTVSSSGKNVSSRTEYALSVR